MGRLRIAIAGMVAGQPDQGGAAWAVLQYVLGLRALGHDVLLVEPVREIAPGTPACFTRLARQFGLEDAAAVVEERSGRTLGLPRAALAERLRPRARTAAQVA